MGFKVTIRWGGGPTEMKKFPTLREAVDWAYEKAANTTRALDYFIVSWVEPE